MTDPNSIRDTLATAYAPDAWRTLLHGVFGNAAHLFAHPADITPELADDSIGTARHIGDLRTSDDKIAAILDIELAAAASTDLRRNRTGLRNLVKKFINGIDHHAVFAVYHRPGDAAWRLSLVIRETSANLETGLLEKRETAPRRFTYLLGPDPRPYPDGTACQASRTPNRNYLGQTGRIILRRHAH